ncbi:Gfo/Idh/MocA family oxidoreductase [Candidatus Poribacteria bacterium]|nr:Gfo/Idh/MocA family oxidoreductase [Candidatus Poribacteria bacterium]
MSQEVKLGFIGCGGNARGHMGTLMNMEGVRIVATCDVVKELATQAAEQCKAQVYTNHKAMLERDDLDGIYISIPVFAHGQPELDTLERGLPFFVEKPVAINLETARKVESAVNNSGIITCVGYQLRYTGVTDIAKEILVGKTISMVSGKYWCGSGQGDPSRWLRQMNKSGGQLVEQATHTIDIIRYLAGEVQEVYAMQANRILSAIDCPDSNVIALRFVSGALGSLTASWTYDPNDWSNANVLDILFDHSHIHWDGGKIILKEKGETKELTRPGQSIDAVFIEAVRTKDSSQIRSPYSDAVKSLAISLAANESGRSGAPKVL